MTDLFDFNLTSSKSRRTYSQRNVSSLQLELTKNRKMINVKTSKTTIINRTISFRPLPVTSSSLANVENTPMKKTSLELNKSIITSSSKEIIEETPVKDEEDIENDNISTDKMTRDIQRLSHRLRSSIPCKICLKHLLYAQDDLDTVRKDLYNIPVYDNQSTKPVTLHLSQVVNRVSRCNYVLRRFVREAEKYSSKSNELQSMSQPALSFQSHEKSRRRLFVDSPKQDTTTSSVCENQPPITPRKASGVIKQLFASPSSSFKRTPSSSSSTTGLIINDKRQKLF